MVNEGDIKKFLRADYFPFQKIQNHTWETVRKSGSLEEVKKEFALNYRIELNGKFRIAHYSFDNSHQRWVYKVVLLVNTKYLNQSFIEIICKKVYNILNFYIHVMLSFVPFLPISPILNSFSISSTKFLS